MSYPISAYDVRIYRYQARYNQVRYRVRYRELHNFDFVYIVHDIAPHLESCTPGTRQYKVVRTGTYQYILFWIRGGTRNVKIVHTSTYQYVRTYDISMAVHTGMYWYVLYGTRRYKEVQPSTRRYMVVQGTVQGGTRQYVLVCTGMY
jgi:hypothetical protein